MRDKTVPANTRDGGAADLFAWGPQFETGIAALDQQHFKLVAIINSLARLPAENIGPEDKSRLLQDGLCALVNYVQYHFGFEIRLMHENRLGSPEMALHEESHKAEHAEFTRRIVEAVAAAQERPAEVSSELLPFLSQWLQGHIMGTDMRMAGKIRAAQDGAPDCAGRPRSPGTVPSA